MMIRDDVPSSRSALLLSLLFLASIFSGPLGLLNSVNAEQVTHFGNSGFPQSVNITFPSQGYDASTNLVLAANGVASSASLNVRGWQGPLASSPSTIGVDVGNDGDLEWAFGGPGNGTFGHVDEFSNGWSRVGVNLSTGSNSNHSIRLPLNATVNSASVDISTLSELTLSGNEMQDTYIRQPNPTWGNAAHKNHNYGNSSYNYVGKTQWSNWNIYRSMFWFNISQLPAVTVLDANLSFWVYDVANNANTGLPVTTQHGYTIYPLLKDWEEGLEYDALVQQGPGVTWNNAIDNVTGMDFAWATAGGSGSTDRGAAIATLTDSPANLEQTWMSFNSQSLTNLVQGWANGSVSNQGLMFVGDETTSKPDASMLKLTARDNTSYGPRLVVVFEGSDDVTGGLDVGNDGSSEWSHVGNLSNGSTTPDFSAALNTYLSNTASTFTDEWGNEFVDVPLGVTGNATLVLDNIDVRYDWNPTITISSQGDLVSEINQHLSVLTPDLSGNVTIPINVTSGSEGVVELYDLNINLGDRPPSIGSLIIPTETIVPNGNQHTIGLEVTSYQDLANLSWVAMTPTLSGISNPPILVHSLVNGTSWAIDSNGFIANVSGNWQELNSDTGRMEWNVEVNWEWPEEQGVVWSAQASTIDNLYTDRSSIQTTNHERRMEIVGFHIWDETSPSEGGPEIFHNEWVAGGDQLRVSGVVRFLDESSSPQQGDVTVELENISGNTTTDSNGAFSIDSHAPNENQYDGFTVRAYIAGNLDFTPQGISERTFRIDSTHPGMMLHSPSAERVIPDSYQLFNVSIIDTIGLDESSLSLRWWVEAMHDDGDGIPQTQEYASKPLLRVGTSEFFHSTFDDTANAQGQRVSLFIDGYDLAGNALAGESGFEGDLIDYISLVPTPTTLTNATLAVHGDSTLVPTHATWLNITLNDGNEIDDIDKIIVNFGSNTEITWTEELGFTSNNPEIQVIDYTLSGEGDSISLDINFRFTSLFQPFVIDNGISLRVTDSSGENVLNTNINWRFNPNIQLTDFSITLVDDPQQIPLVEDDFVSLDSRLKISGRVRYVSADLAPPSNSYEVNLVAPLGNPLLVVSDENGFFTGEISVLSSGPYTVNIEVILGHGSVDPIPETLQLQADDKSPTLIGSQPSFIPANATQLVLQFDLQDVGAGLSNQSVPVTCQLMRGFDAVGEPLHALAVQQVAGDVSRYLLNLTFNPMIENDNLDCWIEIYDLAGNPLTDIGSAPTWPLRLSVIETRADLIATRITMDPEKPKFAENTLVTINIENRGNYTNQPFWVTLEALNQEVAREEARFLQGQFSTTITLTWKPDWDDELDLIIHVDPENLIEEIEENNTIIVRISIESTQEGDFFSLAGAGGIALLLLVCVAMLVLAIRFIRKDLTEDDWEDEFDEDDNFAAEMKTAGPPAHPKSTIQSNNGISDGYEWLEMNGLDYYRNEGSNDEWERWTN